MSKTTIFKIILITFIALFLAYFMFAIRNDKLPGTDQQKKESQWNTELPIIVISKDTLTYSALGIFMYTRQLDTALVSHDGNIINVTPIETPVVRKIAWEILTMYCCIFLIFFLLGRNSKRDKPPPNLPFAIAIVVFLAMYVMVFNLITAIILGGLFILGGMAITVGNPLGKTICEIEILLSIERVTLIRLMHMILFECSFLMAIIMVLNFRMAYPVTEGFEYNGWFMLMMMFTVSVLGLIIGYSITTRALKLEDELVSGVKDYQRLA